MEPWSCRYGARRGRHEALPDRADLRSLAPARAGPARADAPFVAPRTFTSEGVMAQEGPADLPSRFRRDLGPGYPPAPAR